jgi:hypothetical protein
MVADLSAKVKPATVFIDLWWRAYIALVQNIHEGAVQESNAPMI